MAKQAKESKALTIETPKGEITLFKNDKAFDGLTQYPDGVTEATPQQIRFESPGQHIAGQYIGNSEFDSTFKAQGVFHFHEVELPNGVRVGFIGSSQLDRVLCKLEPFAFDVHIIFIEIRDLNDKKVFKCFKVFTKRRVQAPSPKDKDQTTKTPF